MLTNEIIVKIITVTSIKPIFNSQSKLKYIYFNQ